MRMWHRQVQDIINEIDRSIKKHDSEALTLLALAKRLNYSEYHTSRRFSEISGMSLREYIRLRRLAFALKELRDTKRRILDIALDYGFSSNEAFSRAFRKAYGVLPGAYRKNPFPVVLRTVLTPFDCYLLGTGGEGMAKSDSEVKVYFTSIPAHKFLHIRNYESIGYWDFWQKQALVPGQDCETICGLLDSIPHKLDDKGGNQINSGAGQLMAFISDASGRICSWGYPLAEAYGVRLPADYAGPVPGQMILTDVEEGEYIVFEHGPFDFETENAAVEKKIEEAMRAFDYEKTEYELDFTPGRIFYFFHDCERYWRYVRPVKKR